MATDSTETVCKKLQPLVERVRVALDENPEYRDMVFPFGFLITDDDVSGDTDRFPFYGAWDRTDAGRFQFWRHPEQRLYLHRSAGRVLFLIGHAYDPIALTYREEEILGAMATGLLEGQEAYLRVLNQLTGVFVTGIIDDDSLTFYGDAAGMQTCYYGDICGSVFVTSHAALVGALRGLEVSEYVRHLTSYRFYHLFGRALPGDLSPYKELRRLVPNHSAQWRGARLDATRFWPVEPVSGTAIGEAGDIAIQGAAEILQNSMTLASSKWDLPAISLTGGCDSKTTLACANGRYPSFRYFSYVSSPEEDVDATAAAKIAERMGLEHDVINIDTDKVLAKVDVVSLSAIMELNYGDMGPVQRSEVAKHVVLRESDIQVEIKSWVSEVGRAYYHKRFLKRRFPKRPSPRYLTTLFKVFLHDRALVRQTDRIFEEYLARYCSGEAFDRIDWWDIIFWEFRVGAWNGLVISGDHRVRFDIDIPYNNRLLLQALLSLPLADRVRDIPHRRIRDLVNSRINEIGISVTNVKHTSTRARAERLYLEAHSRIAL